MNKVLENSIEKGGKWIRESSRLSARPGEDQCSSFSLPTHNDANFTTQQSAEAIIKYFAKISQEYIPIEEDTSANWMDAQRKINSGPCEHPDIQEHSVYQNMKTAKKTDSVPGDIPASILQEFLPEFANPITAILKTAVETHTWPASYKKEYHIPLQKIPSPQSEDDFRGVGLTCWISKQLALLVLNWIWPYIQPHLDPDQMGGRPGFSIEHYIVKMINFILGSMDGDRDAAVLAVPVDFSKAFNRMLHSDILCNLTALNVPKCAVRLIQLYLTQRTMCIKVQGGHISIREISRWWTPRWTPNWRPILPTGE